MTDRPFQDWEPVVIRSLKKKQENNKKISQAPPKPKIVEDEDGMLPKQKQYTHQMIVALQTARTGKKLSQSDLAKRLNLDTKIIQDIEGNKTPYNRKLFISIMRNLGVDKKSLDEILI